MLWPSFASNSCYHSVTASTFDSEACAVTCPCRGYTYCYHLLCCYADWLLTRSYLRLHRQWPSHRLNLKSHRCYWNVTTWTTIEMNSFGFLTCDWLAGWDRIGAQVDSALPCSCYLLRRYSAHCDYCYLFCSHVYYSVNSYHCFAIAIASMLGCVSTASLIFSNYVPFLIVAKLVPICYFSKCVVTFCFRINFDLPLV